MPDPADRLETVARPKQARSRETLRRLLEAAEELILEKGIHDASIPEIVRRAGSSVGGFYARFKDKNELLRALEERFFQDVNERVDGIADPVRWVGAPLGAIVEAASSELVNVAREKRNLVAAFLGRALQDEDFRAEALRFRARMTERVGALFLGRREELTHPEPELAVDLGIHFAFSMMLQTMIIAEIRAAGRAVSDPELAREIARNFLSYVGAPVPVRSV